MSRKRCGGNRQGKCCQCNSGGGTIEDAGEQIVAIRHLVAREVFKEFCDSSTIHGLKYLRTSSVHEKVMWIIIFTVSISFCAFQISNIWKRWNQDPVIVSFNENLIPIIQIPFPAVTICHQVKTRKELFNYGTIQDKIEAHGVYFPDLSDFDLQQFQLLATTCLKDHTSYEIQNLLNMFDDDYSEPITQSFVSELGPMINETLRSCIGVLEAKRWECQEGFGRLVTEDGFCYTFNLLNKTELLTEGT